MAAIVADSDEIQALAVQLQLAANYAGAAAASVHDGLRLDDLMIAATVDPTGAATFEVTALEVLAGPFGLAGIEAELRHLVGNLVKTAGDYADVDAAIAAGNPMRALTSAIQVTGDVTAFMPVRLSAQVGDDGVVAVAAPRDLPALMQHLADLDDERRDGGDIDIQILRGADGSRQVVVYLPGVDSWDPTKVTDVTDGELAAPAIAGQQSTYEQGVVAAMRRAGVTAADDVTLVGHSLGGAVAVNLAADAYRSGEFNVTHVVTAGAPIGVAARALPASTRLLAIENRPDIVPKIDGSANPNRANITTVTVDEQRGSVLANHGLDSAYVPASDEVAASCDEQVKAFLNSEGNLFTPGPETASTTQRFSIERG